MDTNPASPWNPRIPANLSPADFEKLVLEWLKRAEEGRPLTAKHLGVAEGDGGEYKIDVLVAFSALAGAEFVVLVECKHKRRPVEREDVMVLESKLRDVNAQKAMLFSTSGFQSGALEFASAKHIATVAVVEGSWLYETRSLGAGRVAAPPWAHVAPYAGIRMEKTPTGVSCEAIDMKRISPLSEWLSSERPGGAA